MTIYRPELPASAGGSPRVGRFRTPIVPALAGAAYGPGMEMETRASEVAVRERVALTGLVGAMAFSLGAWAAIVALVVALLP